MRSLSGSIDYLINAVAFGPMVAHHPPSTGKIAGGHFRNDPQVLAQDRELDNFLSLRFGIEAQVGFQLEQLEQHTQALIKMLEKREAR